MHLHRSVVALVGQQQLNQQRQREHKDVNDAIKRNMYYGRLGSASNFLHYAHPDISAVHAAGAAAAAIALINSAPFIHASLAYSADAAQFSNNSSDSDQLHSLATHAQSHLLASSASSSHMQLASALMAAG